MQHACRDWPADLKRGLPPNTLTPLPTTPSLKVSESGNLRRGAAVAAGVAPLWQGPCAGANATNGDAIGAERLLVGWSVCRSCRCTVHAKSAIVRHAAFPAGLGQRCAGCACRRVGASPHWRLANSTVGAPLAVQPIRTSNCSPPSIWLHGYTSMYGSFRGRLTVCTSCCE